MEYDPRPHRAVNQPWPVRSQNGRPVHVPERFRERRKRSRPRVRIKVQVVGGIHLHAPPPPLLPPPPAPVPPMVYQPTPALSYYSPPPDPGMPPLAAFAVGAAIGCLFAALFTSQGSRR